jgi:hypothetical protein
MINTNKRIYSDRLLWPAPFEHKCILRVLCSEGDAQMCLSSRSLEALGKGRNGRSTYTTQCPRAHLGRFHVRLVQIRLVGRQVRGQRLASTLKMTPGMVRNILAGSRVEPVKPKFVPLNSLPRPVGLVT